MDYIPPGSSVHGISQARTPGRVSISFSRGSSQTRDQTHISGISMQVLYHRVTWDDSTQGFSSVHSLSRVRLFVTPWIAEHQASWSITNSQSLLKFMSIESVMPSNNLILYHPFLLWPLIFSSGSFQISQFFASGGQSIGVSALASFLSKNTQDWSPFEWTGWSS